MSNSDEDVDRGERDTPRSGGGFHRRDFLLGAAWAAGAAMMPGGWLHALAEEAQARTLGDPYGTEASGRGRTVNVHTKSKVPDPREIVFEVRYLDRDPIKLRGHFWYNEAIIKSGERCPAIVELNPYRCRDGMISVDSDMYPWFAFKGYLCFRVDLQGSGDSEGVLTDEYTDEELSYCVQVIRQIARHGWCDGNVGMMGESWSAINSLMVAGRDDCPEALKAIIVNCGNDDRYADDIHYMGGAMMQDNAAWASSMFGWLAQPPDPLVVGERWKEMWRERIAGADFWFGRWAAHQTRDDYWRRASVRHHYEKVKVPVLIMSGWQDGYKNPVDRVVRGLTKEGTDVAGLIGPWGHSYPFRGYPGPRINWLPYAVTHWWDKWLKGKEPSPKTELPPFTVWLGRSCEPRISPSYKDLGRWVAEDAQWPDRVKPEIFYLSLRNRLSRKRPSEPARQAGSSHLLYATEMLETSSFGSADNRDLPGDLSRSDGQSLYYETAPLSEDLDCFGYPTATLVLSCNKPCASLAVRLSEISPRTLAAHLVSYSFFNLCYRDGDMAAPKPIDPNVPFSVTIPLNLTGHTFRKGWRIRLSISSSFFPTLWQSPERTAITLYSGGLHALPPSSLMLPGRRPRSEDARMKTLLPADADILSACVEDYVPMQQDPERPGKNTRTVEHCTVDGRNGVLVRKVSDSGRCRYGGILGKLWLEQIARENFMMLEEDPLSVICFTSCETIMERPEKNWRVRSETTTKIWSEQDDAGQCRLKYRATAKAFVGPGRGELLEKKTVTGSVPRKWV